MRVYLDNNILVDIENGVYQVDDFLNVSNSAYYYSNAHINELLNGVDNSIQGLKEKRLSTIEVLCGNKYLFQDTFSSIVLARCTPEQAFENASNTNLLRRIINKMADSFTPNRSGILNELDWYAKEVGNIKPDEILDAVEEKFQASKYHYGIKDYLILSEAHTLSSVYITLFNLLDSISYRKDKNNVARLYDAFHAYFAQQCSILVSNDVRMRAKAEAVYHFLKVKTKVMDASCYLTIGTM